MKDFSETAKDADHTFKLEDAKVETLLSVSRLGSRFLRAASQEEIFQLLLDTINDQIHPSSISVMLLDEKSEYLQIVASLGLSKDIIEQAKIKPGQQISGRVYQSKIPLTINRKNLRLEMGELASLLTRNELSAAISFPLISRDKAIGVINISQTDDRVQYLNSEMELVSILAQFTVTALENIRLSRQKEEMVRIRTLFEQYVSPDVARLLIDRDHQLLDLGTIQDLTVLFADIRNFTLLVQRLDLHTLRTFLNDFFNLFTKTVYENRGTLDKFMGDGALVIFGAPIVQDSPADDAVKTGKEIVRLFADLRRRYQKKNPVFADIGLGIGIGCGEMFIGNLGSEKRLDYTVIGSGVNIAQRLASLSDGDTVMFTDAVLEKLKTSVGISGTETMELKGFDQIFVVHQAA